jgi:16S rRNA (cytidine1402-2'-O)-methyltransferase
MDQGQSAAPATLYLVGTPIGNLADLTFRARSILASVDVIACEDTRHSRTLLDHHGIRRPLVSLHEHNEAARTAQLLDELRAGRSVALISDAGMPLISDPGQRLVHQVRRAGIACEVVPGPSAPIAALVGSGLATGAFYFGGFLPVKSGQRRRAIESALSRAETSVFFESPFRLVKTLECLASLAPSRPLCVARELTKKFEESITAPARDCLAHFQQRPVKGEITLVIAGSDIPTWMSRGIESNGEPGGTPGTGPAPTPPAG